MSSFLFLVTSCSTIKNDTEKTYNQFTYFRSFSLEKDSIKFVFKNPLMCPLRISIGAEDKNLENAFGTLLLKEKYFNVLIPNEKNGLVSVPVNFEPNIKGNDLSKGTQVRRH